MESSTETDSSCRLVKKGSSLLHLKEPLGLKEPLEQQSISLESPTETDSSCRWVKKGLSSPHPMESLGLKEPLEHQTVSQESPTLNNLPQHQKLSPINSSQYPVRFYPSHFLLFLFLFLSSLLKISRILKNYKSSQDPVQNCQSLQCNLKTL